MMSSKEGDMGKNILHSSSGLRSYRGMELNGRLKQPKLKYHKWDNPILSGGTNNSSYSNQWLS